MVADTAQKSERMLEAAFVEVIEEESTDAARFVPVRQEEIAVTPGLVFFVRVRAERLAGRPSGAVPMQHILVERVIRREIEATAEPPDGFALGRRRDQKAHVRVCGRRVRVSRVEHEGQAHGLERRSGDLGPLLACRRRHGRAEHV